LFRSWSRLLLGLNARIPVFFISALFGIKVAGLFGLAHAMIDLPMNLIGTSVAQVYYGEIARYGKSNPDKIRRLSLSIMRKMFILGIIPTGVVAISGSYLFSFAFGPEWHDAGTYAQLLSAIILARFVSSPVTHCFDVLEMQGVYLILNLVRVLFMIAVFVASKSFGLSVFVTIGSYSLGLTVYSAFSVVAVLWALQRNLKCEQG